MPEQQKVIAVIGATGAQGSGLVRAILGDPNGGFKVRALTRNPGSDKGKELAAMGAEVVAADLDDEKSLERAFAASDLAKKPPPAARARMAGAIMYAIAIRARLGARASDLKAFANSMVPTICA